MRLRACLLVSISILIISCKDNSQPSTDQRSNSDTLTTLSADADINTFAAVDVSPMDMSYFPVDYPQLKMANPAIEPPVARVIYSRPHLQGRRLFHGVLRYNEPWRLGANESTEIDFYRDVIIQKKKVVKGRYIIYCIPREQQWTVILNSNIDSWGLTPDSTKDIDRFVLPVSSGNPSLEYYTMIFQKTATGADLLMAWGDMEAKLPLQFQ